MPHKRDKEEPCPASWARMRFLDGLHGLPRIRAGAVTDDNVRKDHRRPILRLMEDAPLRNPGPPGGNRLTVNSSRPNHAMPHACWHRHAQALPRRPWTALQSHPFEGYSLCSRKPPLKSPPEICRPGAEPPVYPGGAPQA